jgi:outer membrane protein OmpA-like peptidoglycan-associated protein
MRTINRFRKRLQVTIVLLLGIASLQNYALAEPPKDCDDRLNDLVLPCFAAYKSDLQSFHVEELKEIAPRVKTRLAAGDFVYIDGYGVFFKTTDPAIENSIKRAKKVRSELIRQLKAIGVTSGFGRIIAQGRGDSSNIEASTTKRQRWFLRRVELSFEKKRRVQVDDDPPAQEICQCSYKCYVLNTFTWNETDDPYFSDLGEKSDEKQCEADATKECSKRLSSYLRFSGCF